MPAFEVLEEIMLLDNEEEYIAVWNRVYNELGFIPGYRESVPFTIELPYCVYGIDNMSIEQLERLEILGKEIMIRVTRDGERIYALDWQHDVFLYDPRNPEEQIDYYVEDARYIGGGFNVYFPSFYPDGDYHFFIGESFDFGLLGHPWRQEIWIFGERLIHEFESVYRELGWVKRQKNTILRRNQNDK